VTVRTTTARVLPVNPHALAQRIARLLKDRDNLMDDPPALLVAAAPVWPYDPILPTRDGLRLRVVPCGSVLAVWEQLTADRETPLVLLTDVPPRELGTGVLSRVLRRQIIDMDPWSLVAECFGAQRLDPRLEDLDWAGPALIEAMPPAGWPRLAGTVLQRDTALRCLVVERLGFAQLNQTAEDIDLTSMLHWTTLPTAPDALARLSEPERAGLLSWLAGELGSPMRALSALLAADRTADALPLGLVCAALWSAGDEPDTLRAQGRVEQYFGDPHLDAPAIRAFGAAATRPWSSCCTPPRAMTLILSGPDG
jgi:hypothetical protein